MLFVVKNKENEYYCGYNKWNTQLRKATVYASYQMAMKTCNDNRFKELCARVVEIQMREVGDYPMSGQ